MFFLYNKKIQFVLIYYFFRFYKFEPYFKLIHINIVIYIYILKSDDDNHKF